MRVIGASARGQAVFRGQEPTTRKVSMNELTPDRSKINPDDPLQTKSWSHELGITKQKLLELIEKVGNSAAAVRKELETEGK